jgi:thymidylate kinase
MIIEFIGTPGAGKTTLLPIVIEALQERGIQAQTVVEASRLYAGRTLLGRVAKRISPLSLQRPLLWQIFYHSSTLSRLKFSLERPALIRQVITSQKQRPKSALTQTRRVLYWFFHTVGYYEFLKAYARPDEALLFDEGFTHRVVQLNVSDAEEPCPSQILAYLNLLPRPNVLISIQAPPKVCERRIYQRGIWDHFRDKSRADVSRFVANAHSVVNLTVDHVKAQGWTVIEVNNQSDELHATQTELFGKLMKIPLPQSV